MACSGVHVTTITGRQGDVLSTKDKSSCAADVSAPGSIFVRSKALSAGAGATTGLTIGYGPEADVTKPNTDRYDDSDPP